MRNSAVRGIVTTVFSAVIVLACGDRDAPKVPLGQPANPVAGGAPGPTITGEARVALDSANALFRARAFDGALAQYRRTAELAPTEVAPLMGIVMVAEATNNTQLRDSTLARIRVLDPTVADSTAVTGHSQMMDMHERVQQQPPPTRQ